MTCIDSPRLEFETRNPFDPPEVPPATYYAVAAVGPDRKQKFYMDLAKELPRRYDTFGEASDVVSAVTPPDGVRLCVMAVWDDTAEKPTFCSFLRNGESARGVVARGEG
ncbi:hypothetical protein [Alienimonas sp. DA493]|uniref:hypothetical protein n=1 Tax=Alienimonas sp. DA493 TaxID=3373605 RepID=UPI0037541C21